MPNIKIVPVVELDPGDYRTAEHTFPDRSRAEDPAGWRSYWDTCLADAGIVGLEPLPDTDHVDVDRLTDAQHLRSICAAAVAGLGPDSDLDQELTALYGGLAILLDDEPFLIPQCCCDLSVWTEWYALAESPPDEWTNLWIGHPWVSARLRNGRLEISQMHEEDAEPTLAFSVEFQRLVAALSDVPTSLQTLATRLLPGLAECLGPQRAQQAAEILCGIREAAED